MSKKNTDSGWLARAAGTSTDRPNRDPVTWNGCAVWAQRDRLPVGDQVGDG
jgi:hypothetical protein